MPSPAHNPADNDASAQPSTAASAQPADSAPEDNVEEGIQCGICMCAMHRMEHALTIDCCHDFCEKCIMDWWEAHAYCPICGETLKSVLVKRSDEFGFTYTAAIDRP